MITLNIPIPEPGGFKLWCALYLDNLQYPTVCGNAVSRGVIVCS